MTTEPQPRNATPPGSVLHEELNLLRGAVSIYSPSREEEAVCRYLVGSMQARGFQAHRDEAGNAIGMVGTGTKKIAFLGHIDTVRGEIEVCEEGGRLFGRGTVDAKGPLCAFISASTRLARKDLLDGKTLIIIGAVEEEAATSRGARYAMNQYSPDFCINGEPSGWNAITLGYKGRILVKYFLRQPMAHTAGGSKSACEQGFDFWHAIRHMADQFNDGKPVFDRLDPSLRQIHSSSDGNYEHVDMWLGFRVPLRFEIESLKQFLSGIAHGAQLQFTGVEQPVKMEKSNRLVRAFLRSIRQVGGDPKFKVKTGTSDMNVVAPVWNCPMVAYGPGDSSLDHTPQEHLVIDEYYRSIDVLEKVLEYL